MYRVSLKATELTLYLTIPINMFGKEKVNPAVICAISTLMAIIGIFTYGAERMNDAESCVGKAFYSLNWYEAPLGSQKLIFRALLQSKQVKFGGFFSYDHASFGRYADVLKRAYNFGVFLLQFVEN